MSDLHENSFDLQVAFAHLWRQSLNLCILQSTIPIPNCVVHNLRSPIPNWFTGSGTSGGTFVLFFSWYHRILGEVCKCVGSYLWATFKIGMYPIVLVSFTLPQILDYDFTVSHWRVYTQWDPVHINVTTELVDICVGTICITRVFNNNVLTKGVAGWEYCNDLSVYQFINWKLSSVYNYVKCTDTRHVTK